MNGYEALHQSAAWLNVSSRGKIAALGEDRARLLHAMTSNHIQQLEPGQGCYAFFLNAQGRILGDVHVFCRPDFLLLDTEPETRRKLFEHLDKYIIADDVALEDRTDSLVAIAVEGPNAAALLASMGAPIPEADDAQLEWGTRLVVKTSLTGQPGFTVIAPAGEKPEVIAAVELAGAVAATAEDFHVVRIENGKPRYGEEITERYLPQETGQMHALHFTKGCYLGQEIVERVRSRAQIHRHLMRVQIDGSEIPAAGTKLTADGKDSAEIVSAVYSPSLGKVAAMAYVRTDFARDGSTVQLLDRPALVKG
ncbi:MAG: glycine cleavage T C-terminal barrel domain-containing protein [Bryobacteraceae bacterium]